MNKDKIMALADAYAESAIEHLPRTRAALVAALDAADREVLQQAQDILNLSEGLKYIAGIVEHGTGKPLDNGTLIHRGVLKYVQGLEAENAKLNKYNHTEHRQRWDELERSFVDRNLHTVEIRTMYEKGLEDAAVICEGRTNLGLAINGCAPAIRRLKEKT